MQKELQEQLFENYPLIFRNKDKPQSQSLLYCGLCVENGWYHLIDQLCGFLQFHHDHNGYPQAIASQVKQKFGVLRFYTKFEDGDRSDRPESYLLGAVHFAEHLSARICELCGAMGAETGLWAVKGYVTTLCLQCRKGQIFEDQPVNSNILKPPGGWKKKDRHLYEEYPLIFKDRSRPMTETCMCWGICTGEGWFDLIDQLCGWLQSQTDKNAYSQVVAEQVKEKFGELCFYVRYEGESEKDIEYLEGAIDFAGNFSGRICEQCGRPGTQTDTGGWIKTLCNECRGKK
ncbi:MAG: hypothetical protein JXK94_00645 [Deltaproteobacteria bacterium]|nr:hypothetical protein [Deltaproteobacteria bacterium]